MQLLKKKGYVFVTVFLLVIASLAVLQREAAEAAATKKLSAITAVYTGGAVLVGESIDLDKLSVMGMYSDGSYVKLKEFSLSAYTVSRAGENRLTIYSGGVSGYFTVEGKTILSLTATYNKDSATVGDTLKREDITVYAYYSNGLGETVTDYSISSTVVSVVGTNRFTVVYQGNTAEFYVTGKEVKRPEKLYVSYFGGPVIVGNAPKRDDFYVTVLYNDNSMEEITSFELTPTVIKKEGDNTFAVSFGGLSAEVKIQGLAKEVVSITAEYKGLPVVIGKTLSLDDIIVTATFNDGSKDTVTNFSVSGSVVYEIGDNLITVFCGDAVAYINVRGVEAEIIDYDNAAEGFVRNGELYSRIKLAVNSKADPKEISIESIKAALVKKAVQRAVKTETFLAFEVVFDNPELDLFLPMTMKVSVPEGIAKENFAVFYTPNRKTILGQMNGEFLKDGTYEFKIFHPGTYVIADCKEMIFVETLELEENEISLRVGRSSSLSPAIYPHNATNKSVVYTSTRPDIVTVDENGLLEALEPGAAVITAETQDGSGKKDTVLVYVYEGRDAFDEEIAELNRRIAEAGTEADFSDFSEWFVADMAKKEKRWKEEKLSAYLEELSVWAEGIMDYCEETEELPFDWYELEELLYELGVY